MFFYIFYLIFKKTAEWNGKWSDNCKLCGLIDEKDKKKIDFKIEQDGEFWYETQSF